MTHNSSLWRSSLFTIAGQLCGLAFGLVIAYALDAAGGPRVGLVIIPATFTALGEAVRMGKIRRNVVGAFSGGATFFLLNWSVGHAEEQYAVVGGIVGWCLGYLPHRLLGVLIGLQAAMALLG